MVQRLQSTVAMSTLSFDTDSKTIGFDLMRVICYWVPIVLIAVAVFDNHARLEYAETAIGMVREYVDEVEASTTASRTKQLTFLSLGALGVLCLVRRSPNARSVSDWTITLPAAFLMIYMYSTMIWSDDPRTTVKRAILATCIAVGSWGYGKAWSLNDFCRAILYLSGLFLVVSIAAEIYYGTFLSLGEPDYRFSGILHPARTAFGCSLMALACFALHRQENRSVFLFLAIVAIGFTFFTKARTGTAALLVASAYFWWRQFSVRGILISIWIGLTLAAGTLFYQGAIGAELNLDKLTRMGREQELADPSKLTGRLPIWNEALTQFRSRPIRGYGYGAFWSAHRITAFERQNGWSMTHAHSAYIETMVNLGLIGLALGLTAIGTTFVRCRKLTGQDALAGSFVGSLILFGLVSGIAESAFVDDGYELIIAVVGISYIAFRKRECETENE